MLRALFAWLDGNCGRLSGAPFPRNSFDGCHHWLIPVTFYRDLALYRDVSLGHHSHLTWRYLMVTLPPRASDQLASVLFEVEASTELEGLSRVLAW